MTDQTDVTPDSGVTPDLRIEYAHAAPGVPSDAPKVIVQSFTVSCTITLPQGDEAPVAPKWEFKPEGEGITPDDCIALATQGIQWCLGARARLAQEHQRRQREAQEQRVLRVEPNVPGVTEAGSVPPGIIPPRRIIRPGEH